MNKINDLSIFRYSITGLLNGGRAGIFGLQSPPITMAMTYENLISIHRAQLAQTSKAESLEQVERNHLTALRAFVLSVHKNVASPIGGELADQFEASVRTHLETSGLSMRSQADRKSLLTRWRNTFLAAANSIPMVAKRERHSAAACPLERNPFEKVLWTALRNAKLAPKTAATLAGTSTSAIGRWARGAIPNVRSVSTFDKLENTLGIPVGTLREAYDVALGTTGGPVIEFREKIKTRQPLIYGLGEADLEDQLKAEWLAHFQYKTSKVVIGLQRSKKARWSLVPARDSTLKPSVFWTLGNMSCASACASWSRLRYFFGFLSLPINQGGYGLERKVSQTLAWLAVPEAVDAYFRFQTERSGGASHRGHAKFATEVMTMLHPAHGYLTQCENFHQKLHIEISAARTWQQMCNDTRNLCAAWKAESTDISRSPSDPIKPLLEKKEPLMAIFSAMEKIKRIGDAEVANSAAEARARRDELLLGFIMSIPLRYKNMVLLTYRSDNSGSVYKSSTGQWRVKIPGSTFKNKGRLGSDIFDVPVAAWLADTMTNYIAVYRPILKGEKEIDHFFLGSNGARFDSLSARIAILTKRYIPETGGFRSHAFRHLVTSDWLEKNPNDFLTVAQLLNDTVSVVIDNYAHLRTDVAFGRYEAYVQKKLSDSQF